MPKGIPNQKPEIEMTPDEKALAARISAGDKSWKTISEEDLNDFSLAEDPYKLPEPAAKRQAKKKFAFRWVEAKASRVDEIQSLAPPARWWICNSTNTPFLAEFCDPAHGGVQKQDQLLMFKPWWMHEKHQAAKMHIAKGKDNTIDKLNGKNEDGVEWKAGAEHRITGSDEVMAVDE